MKQNHITTSRTELAKAIDAMLADHNAAELQGQNMFQPQHPGETYGDNFARSLLDTVRKQREVKQ